MSQGFLSDKIKSICLLVWSCVLLVLSKSLHEFMIVGFQDIVEISVFLHNDPSDSTTNWSRRFVLSVPRDCLTLSFKAFVSFLFNACTAISMFSCSSSIKSLTRIRTYRTRPRSLASPRYESAALVQAASRVSLEQPSVFFQKRTLPRLRILDALPSMSSCAGFTSA